MLKYSSASLILKLGSYVILNRGFLCVKLSFDADPDTREASLVAVGAIMKIAGENIVNECCGNIMEDVNKSTKVFIKLL